MKMLTVQVSRFDPINRRKTTSSKHIMLTFQEGARVLHVLHAIHDETDPTLTYRYCCGTGQCGSCAVRVNGEPVLACMEEARDDIRIEPLDLPVVKDLTVDLIPYISALPAITIDDSAAPRMPAPEVVDQIKPLRTCISCMACVSVCPALQVTTFAGPTVMRQEMRLALDPRDRPDRPTEAV